MRALISFIIAACFIASPAFAKDAKVKAPAKVNKAAAAKKAGKKVAFNASKKNGKFKIRILSYAQLARLSKAKRAKYIKDIRGLLITMEAYQKAYEVARNPYLEKLKDQVAWLMKNANLLPEANAIDDAQRADAYVKWQESRAEGERISKLKKLANVFPVYNGNEWTCGQGLSFDVWAGTCYLENPSGTTTFADAGATDGSAVCPTELGFHDVAHSTTTSNGGSAWIARQRACVPNGSWNKLTPARQTSVDNGERLPAGTFNAPYSQAQLDAAAGGTGVSTEVVTGDTTSGVSAIETKVVPEGTDDKTLVDGEAPVVPDDAVDADADAAAPTCTPAVPGQLACKSLSAEAKAAAIARFRSNGRKDDAICVYGGFLSSYSGGVKKPGGCQAVNKMPYGTHGLDRVKCDTGYALCNPVAFCVKGTMKKADGKEVSGPVFYCAPIQRNSEKNAPITEMCNQEFARILRQEPRKDASGNVVADEVVKGLKNTTYSSCEGLAMTGLPFQEEWDKMKADTEKLLNNWCTDANPDLQALFCTECQILTDRLAKANTDAGASNCDAAAIDPGAKPADAVAPPGEETEAIKENADDMG